MLNDCSNNTLLKDLWRIVADYLIPILISGQLIRAYPCCRHGDQFDMLGTGMAIIQNRIWILGADHLIRIVSMDGTLIKCFGGWGNANEQFRNPMDIVTSEPNQVFISDTSNECVKVFNAAGDFTRKIPYQFGQPSALAISAERKELFIGDQNLIWTFDLDGQYVRQFFASIKFEHIRSIVISDKQVIVLDVQRLIIYLFDIDTGSLLRFYDAVYGIQPRKMVLYKDHLYIAMHDKINIFDMDGLYVHSFSPRSPTALCFIGDELIVADRGCRSLQLQFFR